MSHRLKEFKKQESFSISSIAMLLLALYPMLHWYDIGLPVGLGDMLMMLLSIVAIGLQRFKIRSYPHLFFLVWAYIAINWYYYNVTSDWKSFLPGGIVFVLFVINLGVGISLFNMERLKTIMRWVTISAIVLFFMQFFILIISGRHYILVPNLTGHFTYQDISYAELVAKKTGDIPSAFFIEKAYMAYYLVIYLCLELFTGEGKNRLFTPLSMIIIFTLIMLQSGSGMVGMVIPIITKLAVFYWKKKSVGFLLFVLSVPIAFLLVYFYVGTDMGSAMLGRQEELTTEGTSGFTRVMYGYMYFEQLGTVQQMIGASVSEIQKMIYISYLDKNFALNGVQAILIRLGFVGLALWILFYIKVIKDTTLCGIMCVSVFFVLSAIEVTYLGSYMLLLTIVACAEITQKKKKRYENSVYINTGIR